MKIGGATGGLHEVMALRQEILKRSQALREVRAGTDAQKPETGATNQVAGFADTLHDAIQEVSAVQKRSGACRLPLSEEKSPMWPRLCLPAKRPGLHSRLPFRCVTSSFRPTKTSYEWGAELSG